MMRNLSPWHGGAARLLRCSFFLLVLALASEATPRARPQSMRSSTPFPESDASPAYLPVIGPPPLRFAQGPPPPDLSTRPAPAAPPMPSAEGEIAAANTASAKPAALPRGDDVNALDQLQTQPFEVAPPAPKAPAKAPGNKESPAILPDDAQRDNRPDEILPFFQFPGSGRTTIVVPSGPTSNEPTRLPVSTAVYREH
jgi:hypothetical protein